MSNEEDKCTDCEGSGLRIIGDNSFICLLCDGSGGSRATPVVDELDCHELYISPETVTPDEIGEVLIKSGAIKGDINSFTFIESKPSATPVVNRDEMREVKIPSGKSYDEGYLEATRETLQAAEAKYLGVIEKLAKIAKCIDKSPPDAATYLVTMSREALAEAAPLLRGK